MFTVDKYKIDFMRLPNGATLCRIRDITSEAFCSGLATLHPNDTYDKVEGKKVALSHAMRNWKTDFDKDARTEIWQQFWLWVRTWSHSNAMRYESRGKEKCNERICEETTV